MGGGIHIPIAVEPRSSNACFVDQKMHDDPAYAPYCMLCPGLTRMRRTAPLEAHCSCGASHIIPGNS